MNKKSTIDISLRTILGLVLAVIVLIVILYFIQNILAIFLPGPSAITMANFNRLGDEIKNLGDGNEIIVPYFMLYEDGVKLVTGKQDKECSPSTCLCICNTVTCKKWSKSTCFKGYDVVIENPDNLKIENYNERINLLSIKKGGGIITIKDLAYTCKNGENICCGYVILSGYTKEQVLTPKYEWKKEDDCIKNFKGSIQRCELCPKPS